ncbi:DUF4921 family protein [Gleimia sp. 6138-11-ORH1]|uniref:DUF4921 family protein n=1 Tax=Gleimia sp. 6138-11-ORH1 TaxID=2973937 RepID=UPI00216A89B5|nr:DUF4921 family protein [Gleimia sp. 6138-11-ORH1]MCS4484839.1 DUF4921 family protein [Gleimia sp. 6138-11-ORH1]
MAKAHSEKQALLRCADGTIKQKNLLTGTEVWTVPGRGHRPLAIPTQDDSPVDHSRHGHYCAFCHFRYFETPPEKARVIFDEDTGWKTLEHVPASQLYSTTAEFRRIPNLFEIVSYNYWNLNYGHVPSAEDSQRMARYLADPAGFEHVMRVVRARLAASGLSAEELADMPDGALLPHATGFFSGGHDVIIAKNHYIPDAENKSQLASSGTLSADAHFQYMQFTAQTMQDLYQLNEHVKYVACFQNWLKPAGASFDHLHKQAVAIDETPVQIEAELERLRIDREIYDGIISLAATRKLLLAQNEHAVALAGIGHRFPSIAIWPLGPAYNPWEATPEQMRGVSDLVHAMHAATGAEVPCNEEWYHRPPSVASPMRWRLLIKWRISTLAGFEGGTRIYLNTINPWQVRDRVLPKLYELREAGLIAPMQLGDECRITPKDLR